MGRRLLYWEAINVDESLPHLENKPNNSPTSKKENHKIKNINVERENHIPKKSKNPKEKERERKRKKEYTHMIESGKKTKTTTCSSLFAQLANITTNHCLAWKQNSLDTHTQLVLANTSFILQFNNKAQENKEKKINIGLK